MKTITAVAGILWRGKTFLAVKRPEGKIMAGFWEFPGGKIEKGETPDHALCRELEEELGITEVAFTFWKTVTHAYMHGVITLHLFHVTDFSGEPAPLEKQELRWVSPKEALALSMLPADLPVVRELAEQDAPPHQSAPRMV